MRHVGCIPLKRPRTLSLDPENDLPSLTSFPSIHMQNSEQGQNGASMMLLDEGAKFMVLNKGQDRMDLLFDQHALPHPPRTTNEPTNPPEISPGQPPIAASSSARGEQRRSGTERPRACRGKGHGVSRLPPPRVPVVMSTACEESNLTMEMDETESIPFSCPFKDCPDSLVRKSKKSLACHLASRHVSHGQVVPEAILQVLKMRVCKHPCKTLVPVGARCRNCSAMPQVGVTAAEEPSTPMPMCPPPTGAPPGPGTPTSGPCPDLEPTFEEILSVQVATVRHIPAMCRSAVAMELTRLVSEVAVATPQGVVA